MKKDRSLSKLLGKQNQKIKECKEIKGLRTKSSETTTAKGLENLSRK
jgi:hypothetical protein